MAEDSRGTAGPRPQILGHRGASADAPENTLAAFRLALEQGADGFELDAWRGGTGEVLEALPGALVNVELKSAGLPDLALAGAVARVLRAARAAERCVVSSFDA